MSRLRLPWAILAALLAVLLSTLRAINLDQVIGGYTSCRGCFVLPVLAHDSWLLAIVFALIGAAAFAAPRWLRIFLAAAAATLILMLAVDLELLHLFNQRFYLADLLHFSMHFSADTAAALSVARAQFFSPGGIVYTAFAAVILVVLAGLVAGVRRSRRLGGALLAAAFAASLFAAWTLRQPFRSVHGSYLANVVEANLPPGRVKRFSASFAQREQQAGAALPQTCLSGAPSMRNAVVVIVESLSAYQSALLGGPHDWLPRLDAVARANHYFTHFYANGFTTDGGEIAILTGRPPLIPAGQEWYSLSGFGAGPDTLPGIAHRGGGEAFYFTATDLSFLGSGAWLRGLGFDAVEGNESPFYAGMARSQFGAADDAALFARFEKWLDERTDSRPFISVLLTISSHPPFVDPRSGSIDPAGSFGYVDEELARFYERLKQRGFLADGVLMITGDHRSMTPVLGEEYRKFGERSFARVPLIIAGAVELPNVVDAPFQHSDFAASLAHGMGVDYCRTNFNGIFLDPLPSPPRYVVHARGDNRDRVDVYFDDGLARYRLNGDRSRWEGQTEPPDSGAVTAWINTQRIRNMPAPETGAP